MVKSAVFGIILVMKLVYLLITVAILASCGGGGGGTINITIPSAPTAEDCHAESQILVDGSCQSCPSRAPEYVRDIGCISVPAIPPTWRDCHAVGLILETVGDDVYCRLPREEECHAYERTLSRYGCERCPLATPKFNTATNQCEAQTDTYITAEYRRSTGLETINALYAYERGYFGQGVTVVNVERVLASHEDLRANVLTMDINVDYSDTGVSNESDPLAVAYEEYQAKYNGDRLAIEYFNYLLRLDDLGLVDINELDLDFQYHGTSSGGVIVAEKNNIGGHGVAPQAKLIPIPDTGIFRNSRHYFDDTTKSNTTDLQYIIDNKIPIVNHSIFLNFRSRLGLVDYKLVKDSDSIFVWSSGNFGSAHKQSDNNHITLPFNIPGLEDNWLIVLGYYPKRRPSDTRPESERRVGISCGDVKRWCVTGSGSFDANPVSVGPDNDSYTRFTGTSAAAPSVSGALAVLKSAAPEMSMTAIRAILLTTATDIGDPGIDEVYGWGLVNISAGIVMIENMASAGTEELAAVSFGNLRGELPSGFSHLHNELSAIKLAIKLTTDLYYNVALSEMLTPGNAPNMPLGDAAAEMLENRGEETRRGIFAYGDINTELGLRYYGGGNGYSYIAEGMQSATNNFSGNFGGIGKISGKTYNGKLGFTKAIKANMQLFADYERAKIIGKGEAGNIIKGARNARAESWAAGISFTDIWKYGDRIKLSANQEMKLSGGELIIRYPHAVGDFHKTFTGEETQKIEIRETFLPLKQKAKMHYTAGYAQKLNKKSEWATALEYNAGNNAKALSLIWQGEF